ncbi:MAG: fatty acid desaturase [Cyclobacteriaceae bacterium]|nr:fatty acid desaturase [Cyclobacteriaceae bacterium]
MEDRIIFQEEKDEFYITAKKRVNDYFMEIGEIGKKNIFLYFKAILFLSIHVILYLLLLKSENIWIAASCMILMGPMSILIGINIAHDGAHGAISKYKIVNKFFLSLLDFLGANSYMWKNRHVHSHHLYPNILNSDADLKQNPLIRIFPNDELKSYHRYQYLYAPFLYLLYTMNWLLFRDFHDFTAEKIGSFKIKQHPKNEFLKLLLFKSIYLSYILIVPVIYSNLSISAIILSYILMNFSASILITLALIPSHVAENSLFPLPDEKGMMPNSWSHHQVLTIIDFATKNRFLNFFFGGFNHHVAHHLFPKICHIHYPKITPIIKQTAQEFGLKYNYEDSFINAYISHFKLLKNNGKLILNQT